MLQDLALKLGLTNIREYVDDGITGTKRDRKAFVKMQEDITKGEIGVVMVKDLSRLARDHIMADTLIEEFSPNMMCG
jgi:DNA invertase Pin-like site-specific DNA recombinase